MRVGSGAPADADRIATPHTASRHRSSGRRGGRGPRPDRVGTGPGRRLLRAGLTRAATPCPGRGVVLKVLRGNDRAIVFYEREGGLRTAERPLRRAPDLVVGEVEYT
ncbi:hypothetical protein OG866_08495 [Streptomyces sp. NBC_00663]|uniref:hypothetical protein n=1 Tax=Streptomyces sp. NBC_00663 TaxID=2975801 RepID=UPI002E2F2D95|nr:hypothetical protein [Streptomyces sp. NBC_00663]